MEAGEETHPLEAEGFGPGPFRCFADVRLPLMELAQADPAVMARRRKRIAEQSAYFGIPAHRCGRCLLPADDLYVIADAAQKPRAAICLACVHDTGDGGLIRKATHLDHEFARRLARIHPDRRSMR